MSTFAAMLLPPDAFWSVTDVSIRNNPTNLGTLRGPFGVHAYGQALQYPPLVGVPEVSTLWNYPPDISSAENVNSTWLLQTKLNLAPGLDLNQVRWSIACDNNYQLTVNGVLVNVGIGGAANFSSITGGNGQFPANCLQHGVNDIDVVITGDSSPGIPRGFWGTFGDDLDYFAMFITTDSCFSYPVPQITSPYDQAQFCSPGPITISATVDESTGNAGNPPNVDPCSGVSIPTVAFYDGTNNLGLGTFQSPDQWSYSWANPPPGLHVLTVRATDSDGVSAASVPIAIIVGSYPARPSVTQFLSYNVPPYPSPVYGTEFYNPTSIGLTAMAIEDGCNQNTISSVSFSIYNQGTLVQTLTTSSPGSGAYSATWNASPAPGTYTVIATATDSGGIVSTPSQPSQFIVKGFVSTGSMSTPRYYHSATLLANGSVLVAGGWGSLSTAEVCDPLNGLWAPTGSLINGRYSHTATLLNSGLTIVAGGVGSSGVLKSAELYNANSHTWSAASSMNTARYGHTATLLQNGWVLVTGGDSSSGYLSSTEEYLPGTYWSPAGNMTTNRTGHTATLLRDGRVLVAGGQSMGGNLKSAELFNPSTSTWSLAAPMNTAHYQHTATLLPNGMVLVAGGGGPAYVSAELFDPVAGTWTATGSLNIGRVQHTATLLSQGVVLIAGGYGPLSAAEIYDPISGLFATTSSLGTARALHTATLVPNGMVLIAGGENSGGVLASSEIHYP